MRKTTEDALEFLGENGVDVAEVFLEAAGHRVILSPKARVNGSSIEEVFKSILRETALPEIK